MVDMKVSVRRLVALSLCGVLFWGTACGKGRPVPVRYQGEVSAGFGFDIGSQHRHRFLLETVHGVLVGSSLFCGVGVAYQGYTTQADWAADLVPLFGQVRCYLLDGPVSPYVSFDGGYSFVEFRGLAGMFFQPAFGLSWALGGRTALNTSIGMQLQQFDHGSWLPAISWRVGIAF